MVISAALWLAVPAQAQEGAIAGVEVEVRELEELRAVMAADVEVGVAHPPPGGAGIGAAGDSAEPDEEGFPGGATLKTNPELDRRMKRAEEFARTGRYDLAVILWQAVLDEAADALTTRRDWRSQAGVDSPRVYQRYRSVAELVERRLAQLPPDALKTYRLKADGEARAVLAGAAGGNREAALGQVVRRFFISSIGDDAAFELACRQMDRYEFVGAARLLSKVLFEHPDTNVPRSEILLRLAVANARIGDRDAALAALRALEDSPPFRGPTGLLAHIERDVQQNATGREDPDIHLTRNWRMALGGPQRQGHMPALPSAFRTQLTPVWSQEYDLDLAGSGRATPQRMIVYSGRRRTNVRQGAKTYEELVRHWKGARWFPSGRLLIDGGRIYYAGTSEIPTDEDRKNKDCVICRDARTGELLYEAAWNQYELDPLSQAYLNLGFNVGGGSLPRSAAEIKLFHDRVHHSMSIIDGVLYIVIGRPTIPGLASEPAQQTARPPHFGSRMATPRRSRSNWLMAVDAETGNLRWFRKPEEPGEEESKFQMGFLAAPVAYESLLLVPVTDNGELWLYALAEEKGKDNILHARTAWKTFLCDEPIGGCSPFSRIGLALDSGDCYVATGAGVIFAVEALTGTVRWATRYPRSGQQSGQVVPGGNRNPTLTLDGFDEDVAIPHGRRLLVMASDYDRLFALDRRSGALLWDSPVRPSDGDPPSRYCLGVLGDGLFLAGDKVVRRYDVPSGLLVWQAEVGDSFGRGALTAGGVYVPVKDSVLRLDLNTGRDTGQVSVPTGGVPVGNLFSDGRRLFVVSPGNVYTLTDIEQQLAALSRRIDAGESDLLNERMRLLNRLRRIDEAAADLRALWEAAQKERGAVAAAGGLLDGVIELDLAETRPVAVLRLIAAADRAITAQQGSAGSGAVDTALGAKRDRVLLHALSSIGAGRPDESVKVVLATAAAFDNDRLLDAARRAVASAARPADAGVLTKALAAQPLSEPRKVLAAAGLATALGGEAKPVLQKLLEDGSDRVRLAAAASLANLGERGVLDALAALLESQHISVRGRAAEYLRKLTGRRFGFAAFDPPEKRAAAVKRWRDWLAADGNDVRLSFPVEESPPALGRTLLVNVNSGRVFEIDAAGQVVWEAVVPGAYACQGLPNGNRLVTSVREMTVVEFDAEGNEIWKSNRLPGPPHSVERLPDGGTLVACHNGPLVEIRPDKSMHTLARLDGGPSDAHRLDSGNTLVTLLSGGKVIELDAAGEPVWGLQELASPGSVQRLDNGHTLVAQAFRDRIIEVDRDGNVVGQITGLEQPRDVQRLPDGQTLVLDTKGLKRFDADGRLVETVVKDEALWRMSSY